MANEVEREEICIFFDIISLVEQWRDLSQKNQLIEKCLGDELEKLSSIVLQVRFFLFYRDYLQMLMIMKLEDGGAGDGSTILDELTDKFYELEDLLEECTIKFHFKNTAEAAPQLWEKKDIDEGGQLLKAGRMMLKKPCCKKWKKVAGCFSSRLNYRVGVVDNIALTIKNIRVGIESTLSKVTATGWMQSTLLALDPGSMAAPSTTTTVEKKLYGRDSDMDSLLKILLPEEGAKVEKRVKVISIVGLGGVGKTALAQHLLDNSYVKRNFFPLAMVQVSYGADKEWIAHRLFHHDSPNTSNFMEEIEPALALERLRSAYSGKRFLVFFDGVWDFLPVNAVLNILKDGGAAGSIILATTTREVVGREIGSDHIYRIYPISIYDCWLMLKEITCSGRPEFWSKVKKVGWEIAQKCNGFPLSVETMGNYLRHKNTKKEWKEAKESEIWTMTSGRHLHPLHSSYLVLTPDLKLLFSCCAVFPRNTDINVEQLVRLWMAQGYQYQSEQLKAMAEIKGIQYINILAERGFFQELIKGSVHKNRITSCKMDGGVHDFACFTARSDLARLDRILKRVTSSASSPSNSNSVEVKEVQEIRKLRFFVNISHTPDRVHNKDLFRYLKSVRTLILSCCQLDVLPSEVGTLIHLRTLDLSGNPLIQLPETVCDLNYLEFLDVHFCYLLMSLPQRIGRLTQLSNLRVNDTADELQNFPPGFEKLTSIRTLDVFRVGAARYNDIGKLKDLNNLQEIRIAIHGEVRFGDANLESKTCLENLELSFVGEGRDHKKKSSYIKQLQPPPNLRMLMLEDYPRSQLPKWIMAQSMKRNLTRLSVRSALKLESLPALWKLQSLEFLWMYEIPNLKHLGPEFFGLPTLARTRRKENKEIYSSDLGEDDPAKEAFPSLKTFRIENLDKWETWEDLYEENDGGERGRISVMPKLSELVINGCPILGGLPDCIHEKIQGGLKVFVVKCSSKLLVRTTKRR